MLIVTILFVFSVAFLFQAVYLPMGTLKNVGPGLYPTILSIAMIMLLLVQFVREIKFSSLPKLTMTRYQLLFLFYWGCLFCFWKMPGIWWSELYFVFHFQWFWAGSLKKHINKRTV